MDEVVAVIQTLGIPLGFAVIFLVAIGIGIKTIYNDFKTEKKELLKQMAVTAEAVKQATETNKAVTETNKELVGKIDDKLDQILIQVSK